MPISGAKAIEYVAEDSIGSGTYGVTPDNPTMKWLGLVNPFTPHIAKGYEEVRYLGAYDATDMLQKMRNMKVDGELTASLTYKPQDWDFMQYITGSTTGLSDSVDSLSIAQYTDEKWILYKGCMLTRWELTLPKEGIATVDVDMTIGDVADPTGTDFIGTGSHASESTDDPFLWEDITGLKMDSNDPPTTEIAHSVGDLTLSITNEVELPKDISSTKWTRAEGAVVKKRDISVSMELTWVDIDSFFTLVKNGTKQNLQFTLGGKTFTIKGLIPPEYNPEITPDNFIGETVTFLMDQPDLTIA